MKDGRKITGYQDLYLSEIPKIDLTTTRHLTDEYFASLQYYSEIEEVGLEFIKDLGYKDTDLQKRIFLLFQSFVRQGKSFFDAAEKLDYRTSPLLYYYSFLNLTKAYLCLVVPDVIDQKIRHGLTHKHTQTEFQSQTVHIAQEGVFPILYKAIIGTPIEPIQLNISRLLGYIPDINYEFKMVNYGQSKFISGISRVTTNAQTKKAWPLLALTELELIKNQTMYKSFFDFFEEIKLQDFIAMEIFNINGEEKEHFSFMQSRIEYELTLENYAPRTQIRRDCLSFMKNYCQPLFMKSKMDYFLFLPLDENNQLPFNDILATYVVMYYLGSLVRYFPSYLESLLNSKHAWIIESFTKQVGVVFLRNICSLTIRKRPIYSTI